MSANPRSSTSSDHEVRTAPRGGSDRRAATRARDSESVRPTRPANPAYGASWPLGHRVTRPGTRPGPSASSCRREDQDDDDHERAEDVGGVEVSA